MGLYKKKSVSSRMQLLTWKPSHLLRLKNHGGSKTDIMRSFPPSKNAICDQPLLTITQNEKEFSPIPLSSHVVKSGYRKSPINIIFFDWRIQGLSLWRLILKGKRCHYPVLIAFSERNAKLPKQTPKCVNSRRVYHTICVNGSTKPPELPFIAYTAFSVWLQVKAADLGCSGLGMCELNQTQPRSQAVRLCDVKGCGDRRKAHLSSLGSHLTPSSRPKPSSERS